MGFEDIIEKLPEMYRPLVRTQIKILVRISEEETKKWLLLMLDDKFEEAHKRLLKQMTTQEVLDDTKELNEIMRQLNKEAKAEANMWREFFLQILLLGLARVKKEIVE